MKLNITIKLQKAILGARRSTKFRILDTVIKDGVLMWEIDQLQWRWAMNEALAAMGIADQTTADFIRLPLYIQCPKVNYYERAYRSEGERKKEVFESFRGGSIFTIPVTILRNKENEHDAGIRPPTKEEALKMFSIIGEDVGISPWGSKFGYGRFYVTRCENDVTES